MTSFSHLVIVINDIIPISFYSFPFPNTFYIFKFKDVDISCLKTLKTCAVRDTK